MPKFVSPENGSEFTTEDERQIQFINDMTKAGIQWRVYSGRGMMGRECPAASTDDDLTHEDIIRATKVKGLQRDNMGRGLILYTG